MSAPSGEITRLLMELSRGNRGAEQQLIPLVYNQLRRIAANQMRSESPDLLQPTALVHEAYMRLLRHDRIHWKCRAQFYAIASGIMRRILVDEARKRSAAKRTAPPPEHTDALSGSLRPESLIALDEALSRLTDWNARQGQVVEMLFFGGLTEEEAAEVLAVSARTVKRDWQAARAWLHAQLGDSRV
jgi:RNA polymerase sigma factor (TIGR02999 family)